ncbi:MAG: hypothetical protein GY776_16650 [Alteromonas sp.]|nr:hypothetical protein [Alteromonas sp.]
MQYSTEQKFSYLEKDETLALTVKANGGQLDISSWDGGQYISADTISVDGVYEYFVKGQNLKFTPTGGCTFSIRKGY